MIIETLATAVSTRVCGCWWNSVSVGKNENYCLYLIYLLFINLPYVGYNIGEVIISECPGLEIK